MKCLQVLALAKADFTLTGMYGPPIGAAAAQGSVDIVHFLVQANADVDADHLLETPVLRAARCGHAHVVHMLIQAKADATRCLKYCNASPLFVAAARGHVEVVRCLLAHVPALAAVATRQDFYITSGQILAGSTPLDVARQFRHDDVVALIVAATATQ